jgi:hypothetical protein
MMKKTSAFFLCAFLLTATLQVRLSHDNKKGYSYIISGPTLEEVLEADQKMKQYLKSQAPKKNASSAPAAPGPKPTPQKK